MEINYRSDFIPETDQIIEVYRESGINRPIEDEQRIKIMYENSNLVITAWANGKLIGIARSLTDYCYACYLSDLAVRREYQKSGIGTQLIERIKDLVGDETALILLSAPSAMEYYPKIGFQKIENGFIIKRKK